MSAFINKEINSFGYAIEGISFAIKTQANFKIQLVIGSASVIFAIVFNFTAIEWIILILTITFVLSAELVNTAIEELVNLSTTEFHPKAKIAKDLSAAVVLIVSILAAIVGLFLFLPHIY